MGKEREPIAWITRGGKHIPIFVDEPTEDEKKKDREIAASKKQAKQKTQEDDLYNKLKTEGYRMSKGTLDGKAVVMCLNGQMANGSSTYVQVFENSEDILSGKEPDGYIRQYQKDKHNRFYLLTEDKAYY